eukprot:GHVO01006028.1.p1 GENE.GHVO01006028.1~~GHVO01006028.1.p1  ORF type:complete len:461 (-),score=70.40 GHVO01006028.1:293-1675(-)
MAKVVDLKWLGELAEDRSNSQCIHAIVLNRPIPLVGLRVLKTAQWIVCADGGANRMYDTVGESILPNLICGDLDSVRNDVSDHYTSLGVPHIGVDDQDSNDCQKCLDHITGERGGVKNVCMIGFDGGRYDQMCCNISVAIRFSKYHTAMVYMIGEESVVFYRPQGVYNFIFPETFVGRGVGVLAAEGRISSITSIGLQYDLDGSVLQMGGVVSSSNKITKSEVFIEADNAFLFHIDFIYTGGDHPGCTEQLMSGHGGERGQLTDTAESRERRGEGDNERRGEGDNERRGEGDNERLYHCVEDSENPRAVSSGLFNPQQPPVLSGPQQLQLPSSMKEAGARLPEDATVEETYRHIEITLYALFIIDPNFRRFQKSLAWSSFFRKMAAPKLRQEFMVFTRMPGDPLLADVPFSRLRREQKRPRTTRGGKKTSGAKSHFGAGSKTTSQAENKTGRTNLNDKVQ